MAKWSCRSFAEGRPSRTARLASVALTGALTLGATGAIGAQQAPAATASGLLQQAAEAEASGQIDAAIDRLYTVQLERPRTPEAMSARASLARLLVLQGDLPSALLQAQALRDEAPPDSPQRQAMLDLTTLMARHLRTTTPSSMYGAPETQAARGLTNLDEPTALMFEPSGALLLVDQGNNRIYRIAGESTTTLNVTQEPTAATPFGTAVIVGGKNGLTAAPAGPPLPTSGTWNGKARPVRKIRSVAANSRGDLFVVDRDYDGLLRCAAGATSCAPWGPPGKLRVVKVGPSDLVVTLTDKQNIVRVVDPAGKLLTTVGPSIGAARLQATVDVDVDRAYCLYLLDGDLRRVDIVALRIGPDGRTSAEPIGTVTIPAEGQRAIKDPSALAVSPDGTVVVAGKGTSQLLRFR
jgi:hypothetical protein